MGNNNREWCRFLATTLCLGILGFGPVSASNHEFSFVILPDTQTYTAKRPQIMEAQIDWITANRLIENIVYVGHLGDLKDVNNCINGTIAWPSLGDPHTEWEIVRDAFDQLDTAGIPYGVTPGNHDFDRASGVFPADTGPCPNYTSNRPLVGYNIEFPPSSFPITNYGSRLPGNNEDNFTIASSNGFDFLFINMGYQQSTPAAGSTAVIDWAETLIGTTYPNHIAIVISHFLIDCNASTGALVGANSSCEGTPDYLMSTYGNNIFDRLRSYKNLFMMIGGHRFGESYISLDRTMEGFNPVHAVLANYQHMAYASSGFDAVPIPDIGGGFSGFFKLMRFDMDSMTVDMVSLSPDIAAQSTISGSSPIMSVLSNAAHPTTFSTLDIDPTNPANLFDGTDPTLHAQSVSNLVNISFADYVDFVPTFDIHKCEDMAGMTCITSLGSMELPSSSGTQTDGSGITLNYKCLSPGFCGFGGTIYDEGTIQSVDWVVDAGTGELTTFNMVLNNSPGCLDGTGPLPCNQTEAELTLISPGLISVTMTDGGCELIMGSLSCNSNVTVNNPNLFVP